MNEVLEDTSIIIVDDEFIRGVGSTDLSDDRVLATRRLSESGIVRHQLEGVPHNYLGHEDGIYSSATVVIGLGRSRGGVNPAPISSPSRLRLCFGRRQSSRLEDETDAAI